MKHLLVFLLALAPFAAHGGPIENMRAQCDKVMSQGDCRVALDPREYVDPRGVPILLPDGMHWVKRDAYLAIAALRFEKDAQGNWLMCKGVLDACKVWSSDACIVYRFSYRQTPP
jgi:hypothetical protein